MLITSNSSILSIVLRFSFQARNNHNLQMYLEFIQHKNVDIVYIMEVILKYMFGIANDSNNPKLV